MTYFQRFPMETGKVLDITPRVMKRTALLIVALMLCMSVQPSMAEITAPNDNAISGGTQTTLSIDGFVNTKLATVGSAVEINALTRGHSSSTIVTADIIHYDVTPIDAIKGADVFGDVGTYIDTVVLTSNGPHEEDGNTMTWEGTYVVPVYALGGLYGARIFAEDGNMRVADDPTQLQEVLRGEVEKLLQSVDTAWDSANPTMAIKSEFDVLDAEGTSQGGWSSFVTTATKEPGSGNSEELWDAMIYAGHNQYEMSAGADFLEALMEFFDSNDVDASMSLITGLLLYLHELPLPRTLNDFDELAEYMQTFNAIENFTRFEGTGDFEAAYNAMLGSDEWAALEGALDNLANGTKSFESVQIIMHNLALLSVSVHPDAIAEALEAWILPLMEGDEESMTPYQKLLFKWIVMAEELAETDVQDLDGDERPDVITWQYEYLLETTEGQAWTAKMESSASSSYVNDVFDDFNTLPEDIIDHAFTAMDHPALGDVMEDLATFTDWMENASGVDRNLDWEPSEEEGEGESGESDDSVIFEELYDVRTSVYDANILDIGIEMAFWGPWDDDDYPTQFSMSMNNNHGAMVSTVLQQDDDDRHRYYGRLTATHIEDATWSFTQPLENFEPDCASMGCEIERAELNMETLRPSMLEAMSWESSDEHFIVSAVGVLVEQDETTLVSAPYDVTALTYDYAGSVAGAEVDIAILRTSPQLIEEALSQFESEGGVEITLSTSMVTGSYDGSDLDGDLSATISEYSGDEDREERQGHYHPQTAEIEDDIEISGMGSYWSASSSSLPNGGLADVITTGVTDTGLEFEFMQQVPLPGTSGCARTEASGGDRWVNVGWNYENFRHDEGEFEKPGLSSISIDWGDGDSWMHQNGAAGEEDREDGWESHEYAEGTWDEYDITVQYTDENNDETTHYLNYNRYQGFWKESSESHEGWIEVGWCELKSDESFMPSAQIIDAFFTDGPFEVIDEQIMTSGSDGEVSLTVQPNLPGVYISIVQSQITRDDGATLTGLSMNLVAVTEASVSFGDLHQETTIAGMPVYTVSTDSGGLTTITVTPTGVDADDYTAWLGIAPMDLSVAFPDIDDEVWSEATEYELEFQQGDTSRSQEVRLTSPVTMIAVMINEDEEQLFPNAIHAGILLNNPGSLEMDGTLGPGQTTNIALSAADGVASRILALAAPESGLDPASIDLGAFTELAWGEGVREEVGWIAAENELTEVCEQFESYHEEDGTTTEDMSNVRMILRQGMNYDYTSFTPDPNYDASNAVLTDWDDTVITPVSDWTWDSEKGYYYAKYSVNTQETRLYTLTSNSDYQGEYQFHVEYGDDNWWWIEGDSDWSMCPGDQEESEIEAFEMFDDFFGRLDSVAWGQGSSADLRLPILSAPQDTYTVLAIAQVGDGEDAEMIAALNWAEAEPNPEPPVMTNLSMSFSPANPMPGDIVQITVVNEDHQPVDGLSVTLVRDDVTLYGMVTDDNGQVLFGVTVGTIIVRVSGGMYNPAELTIIVTDDGVVLPTDTDGDGVNDADDDCPGTPSGAQVDALGCTLPDTDGDGVYDIDDDCPNTTVGTIVDATGCALPDGGTGNGTGNQTGNETGNGTDNGTGNVTGNETGDGSSGDSGVSSSTFLTNALLIIGIIVGLVVLVAAVGTVIVITRKRKDEGVWNEDLMNEVDRAFEPGPDVPAPGMVGEMRDGYEVLEHPEGSDSWWWKDPTTGQWNEWT